MMAAAQPFLSGAISKTVNMPSDVTPEDIADAYFWGWQLGLKALAIYRDGIEAEPAAQHQVAKATKDKDEKAGRRAKPRRERLPDTRQLDHAQVQRRRPRGLHQRRHVSPTAAPASCSSRWPRKARTVGGMMDAFGTAISMSLQYGVPLEALVNKFSHMRFEPMGHTTNPDIRIAKSMVDYIFRWMGIRFLAGYREAHSDLNDKPQVPTPKRTSTLSIGPPP